VEPRKEEESPTLFTCTFSFINCINLTLWYCSQSRASRSTDCHYNGGQLLLEEERLVVTKLHGQFQLPPTNFITHPLASAIETTYFLWDAAQNHLLAVERPTACLLRQEMGIHSLQTIAAITLH